MVILLKMQELVIGRWQVIRKEFLNYLIKFVITINKT